MLFSGPQVEQGVGLLTGTGLLEPVGAYVRAVQRRPLRLERGLHPAEPGQELPLCEHPLGDAGLYRDHQAPEAGVTSVPFKSRKAAFISPYDRLCGIDSTR